MQTGAPIETLIQDWNQSAAAEPWILISLSGCLNHLRQGSVDSLLQRKNINHTIELFAGDAANQQRPGGRASGDLGFDNHLVAIQRDSLTWLSPLARESILLAASRFSRSGHTDSSILESAIAAAVRTRLVQLALNDTRPCLISGEGMTLDPVVLAVARSFGLPLIRFRPSKKKSLASWFTSLRSIAEDTLANPSICNVRISPPLNRSANSPNMDSMVFAAAQHVHGFLLQSKSKTLRLLKSRLKAGHDSDTKRIPPRIWVPDREIVEANKPLLDHHHLATELMSDGCVGWYLPKDDPDSTVRVLPRPSDVRRFPEDLTGYVFHHTRSCKDAWPDETEDERWLRWLLGTSDTESHGPQLTLQRILAQGILRASGKLIPTGRPMICFSQRPPRDSFAARTFRSHLNRWDYEPYGLAVLQTSLMEQGAKVVQYWEQQPPSDVGLEFTQKRFTESAKGQRVDWSLEQEIRLPGQLDLRTMGQNEVVLFVPTKPEAQQLAEMSRWPVGYLFDQ